MLLKFSKSSDNAKLRNNKKKLYIFSLPSGFSCPGALKCLARANRITGKIIDGINQEFRCYSSLAEAAYPSVRLQRWHNFELLENQKTLQDIINLIQNSLPKDAEEIRLGGAGDFFNQNIFDAWLKIAQNNPHIFFYSYTKSLLFWINRLDEVKNTKNFVLTASYGGKYDNLIKEYNLKNAEVIIDFNRIMRLEKQKRLDHNDDSVKNRRIKKTYLNVHGTQKAGTKANENWLKVKKTIGGYSR